MTFSLCFQLVNARHFKSPIDIWGNFVPGMIFFQSIFGYLAVCMLYKWGVDWPARGESPPSLLNMLINMFLSPGTVTERLYAGQGPIQVILILIAVINVPILLLLKPLYLRYEHNKARRLGYSGIGEVAHVSALDNDDDATFVGNGNNRESVTSDREAAAMVTQDIDDGEHEEFEFSEEMIHQTIHTIGTSPYLPRSLYPLTPARILSQLRFSHGFLSPALGTVSGPSTTLQSPVENDNAQCLLIYRTHWSYLDGCCFWLLVLLHHCHSLCDGRH